MAENGLKKKNDEINLFTLNQSFKVTLTYGWLPEPIVFFMRILMSSEEKEARQAFYAKSKSQQLDDGHRYRCELISKLCTSTPENLPGFSDFYASLQEDENRPQQTANPGQKANIERVIFEYFYRENDFLIQIADNLYNEYTRITQPAEFFRGI